MKKIGIFGGTFSPVHNEHIAIARQAIKELQLDKLYIVPTFMPPHKSKAPISGEHRLNMLKLAFSDMEKVEINEYELNSLGKSYTYLTVSHFKELHKDAQLYFIVGGDMLTDFKTWKNPEIIMDKCDLAVFNRDDFYTDYTLENELFIKRFNKGYIKLNYNGKGVSSTRIRVYSMLNLSLDGQVPKSVEEYIIKNDIYKGDFIADFIKTALPEKRLIHTAEVAVSALSKAKELGLSEDKVLTTSLLHDCAKYLDKSAFKGFELPSDVPKPVEHAFLGAFVAEKVLNITDQEIIDAIRYHTSGKANMTTLSKLVFVADMVERGRDYEGVEKLRELFNKDFERCFIECLIEEVEHLKNKKSVIYVETLNAYDYYVKGAK